VIPPAAGPPFRSQALFAAAAVLVWVWLLGIAGFYHSGMLVHVLLVAAALLLMIAVHTAWRGA
jgi:hypothetical protein